MELIHKFNTYDKQTKIYVGLGVTCAIVVVVVLIWWLVSSSSTPQLTNGVMNNIETNANNIVIPTYNPSDPYPVYNPNVNIPTIKPNRDISQLVVFYNEPDFNSEPMGALHQGNWNPSSTSFKDNMISALSVPKGFQVTLYDTESNEDDTVKNTRVTFGEGNHILDKSIDNKTSYIQIKNV